MHLSFWRSRIPYLALGGKTLRREKATVTQPALYIESNTLFTVIHMVPVAAELDLDLLRNIAPFFFSLHGIRLNAAHKNIASPKLRSSTPPPLLLLLHFTAIRLGVH